MSRYIYRCGNCGKEQEVIHPMSVDVEVPCIQCGSIDTHRVPQVANVVYATTGFYHIDSGKRFESQLSERGKEIWKRKKVEAGV